jgi:polysaccharide export outer membrane protein
MAGEPPPQPQPPMAQPEYEFGSSLKEPGTQRVLRIPLEELRNGNFRYNIVIRPNDQIFVPLVQNDLYYMAGHVRAPGPYSLVGQKMNLKQAVASAGMLDGLAVPQKTDIIRRIGDNELFLRVDLAKIWEGRQPDVYLKPNDIITVGTDWYPPFLQALRGAFRVTYGFGFLYDKNFGDDDDF